MKKSGVVEKIGAMLMALVMTMAACTTVYAAAADPAHLQYKYVYFTDNVLTQKLDFVNRQIYNYTSDDDSYVMRYDANGNSVDVSDMHFHWTNNNALVKLTSSACPPHTKSKVVKLINNFGWCTQAYGKFVSFYFTFSVNFKYSYKVK